MSAFTRLNLEKKIKEIFGVNEISHLIDTQITNYVTTKGYTYLDIARSLAYFYVVQDGDISKARGIAIVPYVIKEAQEYFEKEAARVNAQMNDADKYKDNNSVDIICHQKLKKPERKRPFIDLNEIEVSDND